MSRAPSGAGRRRRPLETSAPIPIAPRGGRLRLAAFVFVAWALIWWPQLFTGRVFAGGDWPEEIGYAELSSARWRESRERTFWNPYLFTGVPASASLADARPQFLPDAALDAIAALESAPVWPPLIPPLLAHLAGMLAVAALARALWNAGAMPAAWAAIAWGLVPFQLVPFAFGHRAQLITVGLMPVTLLVVDALFRAESARRAQVAALALAAVAAIQLAAGHPQFTYLSLLLAGGFAIERARRFGRAPRLAFALGAVALAIAIAAAVWLPMLRYGAESVRGLGVLPDEVLRYSFAPRDFLAFAWPGAVGRAGGTYWGGMNGTDFPQYAGVLTLLLAAFAWRRGRDGAATLLAGAALLAALLALGFRLGPLYEWIHAHLPFWSRFRVAVAPLIVAQLALVLLAARGLDAVLAAPAARRAWLAAAGAALALAAVAYFGAEAFLRAYAGIAASARSGFPAENAQGAAMTALPSLILTLLALGAGAGALAFAGAERGAATGAVLIALTAFDLGIISVAFLRDATVGREALATPARTPFAALVAVEPGHRASSTDPERLRTGTEWSRWRLGWTGGAHGTPPRRWSELAASGALASAPVQRALAARVVSAPADVALSSLDYEPLAERDGDRRLWRLRETRPRAWAVVRVEHRADDAAVLAAMTGDPAFPAAVAFTTDARAAGAYAGSGRARLAWLEDAPDRLAFEVEQPGPAFVVVADAWFEGWSATLDGAPVEIHRVNHLQRGVAIPPGAHRVAMRYQPPGARAGAGVSAVALAIFAALGVLAFATGRKPPRSAA